MLKRIKHAHALELAPMPRKDTDKVFVTIDALSKEELRLFMEQVVLNFFRQDGDEKTSHWDLQKDLNGADVINDITLALPKAVLDAVAAVTPRK